MDVKAVKGGMKQSVILIEAKTKSSLKKTKYVFLIGQDGGHEGLQVAPGVDENPYHGKSN